MDENIELLEYIYQNASMGVNNLTTLIKQLNELDNKIKKTVEEELKGYEKYLKESEKLIKKSKREIKDNSMMTKMMSTVGIKKEVKSDNSDSSIAKMLTQGITMGIVEITSKIDRYKKTVDKNILKLSKDFLKFQEDELNKLKSYL